MHQAIISLGSNLGNRLELLQRALTLIEKELPLPAYEKALKASHLFNLLDARKAISVTERQQFILKVRNMSKQVAQMYYQSRAALGFPGLKNTDMDNQQEAK